MAIAYTLLGLIVAIMTGGAAAFAGFSPMGVMALYAGAGTAVLMAVIVSAMLVSNDADTLHEDAMLIPGE